MWKVLREIPLGGWVALTLHVLLIPFGILLGIRGIFAGYILAGIETVVVMLAISHLVSLARRG
jgi:hypothetical protein